VGLAVASEAAAGLQRVLSQLGSTLATALPMLATVAVTCHAVRCGPAQPAPLRRLGSHPGRADCASAAW
jgi:hypothetical protein